MMNIRANHLFRIMAGIAAAGLLVGASACGTTHGETTPESPEPTGPITVVASVNQWGSLAEQIGGDDVTVTSILSSTGVDAHDFEPKTSDLAALSKARIVVFNGAGYDSWATKTVGKDAVSVSAAQTVGAMEGDNPHLWFSKDARNGMAKELADAFSKALPQKKKAFTKRYKAWQKREQVIEDAMDEFAKAHKDATYAATEAVAYYLMSDMGFEDLTPSGYATSAAAESEPAPADLQEFQTLIEKHGVDLLVNNVQASSDATNMITGTAGRSDVPVVDVSEQMPQDADDLTAWIESLVDDIIDAAEPDDDCADDAGGANDGNDADGTGDDSTDNETSSCTPSSDGGGTGADTQSDAKTDADSGTGTAQ